MLNKQETTGIPFSVVLLTHLLRSQSLRWSLGEQDSQVNVDQLYAHRDKALINIFSEHFSSKDWRLSKANKLLSFNRESTWAQVNEFTQLSL